MKHSDFLHVCRGLNFKRSRSISLKYKGDYLSIMGGGHTESQRVSAQAFMLMEELDGPLERLEERVDTIFVSTISSNLLSAIAARLSRQEQQATEVHILELEVETEREAFETRIMMTSCTVCNAHHWSSI